VPGSSIALVDYLPIWSSPWARAPCAKSARNRSPKTLHADQAKRCMARQMPVEAFRRRTESEGAACAYSDRETVVNVLAGISEHVMSDGEIGGRSRAVPPVRASFNSAIEKNVRSRTLGACQRIGFIAQVWRSSGRIMKGHQISVAREETANDDPTRYKPVTKERRGNEHIWAWTDLSGWLRRG